MQADELRTLQAPLKAQYREHPESALCAMRVELELDPPRIGCRAQPRTTNVAGLHPAAGGTGNDLCSGDMLLESLAACAGVTLCAVATAINVPLAGGQVVAEGDLDFRGTLGVSRDAPIGMQNLRLSFRLRTDVDDATLAKLLQLTERYCVIAQTLAAPHPISGRIERLP